ncbi:MAG TPA: DUF5668 domain-containing protein [Candidatus Aquilonibacter sp.]|nr:DUF5668 domain-containing protein [Candidatus Aquilonibacter sp.]
MSDQPRRFVGPGLWVGLWITALGVIFLLDQLGIVPARISFHLVWPLILVGFGLGGVLSNNPGHRFWGAVVLTIGGLSLSNQLGFLHIRLVVLWPLFLIGLGVWMLFSSTGRIGLNRYNWNWWQGHGWSVGPQQGHPPQGGVQPPPTRADFAGSQPADSWQEADSGDPVFDQSVILSGFKRRVTSQHFRFGKVAAVLGGFNLDFTQADIDGDRAVLQVDMVFGGGEVRVPQTWDVVIQGSAIAGAFVDETYGRPAGAPPNAKKLIVRGAAVFGGVSIKN